MIYASSSKGHPDKRFSSSGGRNGTHSPLQSVWFLSCIVSPLYVNKEINAYVAVEQTRLESNAGDNPAKDWDSFFQFLRKLD